MAAEEKKPKIDLKARLGKAQGAAGGGGTPVGVPAATGQMSSVAPPQMGSVSPPAIGSIPPPHVGGSSPRPGGAGVGVPAPPFGGQQATVDDGFGSRVAAPVMRAAPAIMKIELDAETVAAAQKGGKRGAILGIVGVIVGGVLGYAYGGASANGKGADAALQGAKELVAEIDQSQAKIKEMSDKIGGAVKSMKEKKFPDSFSNDLGGLSIPFGPEKLSGRNIGRFDPRTLSMLFSYASSVEALNDRKDALKNLFAGQKKFIQEALGASTTPKVTWSVTVKKDSHGPVGMLAAVNPADAFVFKEANWPASFKIGKENLQADRAGKEVVSDGKKVYAIPLDPDSVSTSFPTDVLSRILGELTKTEAVLSGSGTPGEGDDQGIMKKGEQLLIALKKIGQK